MTVEDLKEFFLIQRRQYQNTPGERRINTTELLAQDLGLSVSTVRGWCDRGDGFNYTVKVLNAIEKLGFEVKIRKIRP